jgi:hypothetical protein
VDVNLLSIYSPMLAQTHYLIRSKTDGSYLAAYPNLAANDPRTPDRGYLLLFKEHFDALTYLNTHASGMSDRFAVESLAGTQLPNVMNRWSFKGVGVVQDPLIPRVEFLQR